MSRSPGLRPLAPVLVLVATVLAGCAGGSSPTGEPSPTSGPSPTAGPSPTSSVSPTPGSDAVPSAVVDQVVAAATDRTGVPPAQVEVLRAVAVEWPSSALGCPEEGQMYTQVITPGYWVVVEAGGEQLDYRMAQQGEPRLCEDGTPPPGHDQP